MVNGMTRRRVLLALVVTVLAVGCAAPWWEDVWLAVAYEEVSDIPTGFEGVIQGKTITVASTSSNVPPPKWHKKRSALLPGEDYLPIDQLCVLCADQDCEGCDVGWKISTRLGYPVTVFSSEVDELTGFCICPTCYPERQ